MLVVYIRKGWGGGGQNLWLLAPILIILAVIISSSCSNGEETKSSQAEITELTVTINSADYPITFDADRAFTVSIPAAETIPGKIAVKSAVISEKASGLQESDELAVTNNQVKIAITAEDGTNIDYTLFIALKPLKVTANEIPKRTTTDVRDSYVLFSIEANKNISHYHLAVKETNEAIPTTTEMIAGALKRNLSTNSINVLIAQRLNAPMVTFAEKYFADNTHQTLGTDMLKTLRAAYNFGLIYDGSAAGTEAWVKESVLKASTGYTLYGMEEGGNKVAVLQTFVTDDTLGIPTTESEISYTDSTLEEGHIEIAINANELYIFPLQVQLNTPFTLDFLQLRFSHKTGGNLLVTVPNSIGEPGSIFGGPLDNPNYVYMLYLFKNMGSLKEVYASSAIYVLMGTGFLNYNTLQYGLAYNLRGIENIPGISHSILVKQQ